MKISEIVSVSSKKERSLKRIVSRIKKEFPRAFKNARMTIETEWTTQTTALITLIGLDGELSDSKSWNSMVRDLDSIIGADDGPIKHEHIGGAWEREYGDAFIVFEIKYATNI